MDNSKLCPRCQSPNLCAISAGKAANTCWCMQTKPHSSSSTITQNACYCESCLSVLSSSNTEDIVRS